MLELVDRLHGKSLCVCVHYIVYIPKFGCYEQSALFCKQCECLIPFGADPIFQMESTSTSTTCSAASSAAGGKVKRSSVPTIRSSMLDKGALLFRFEQPSTVTTAATPKEHTLWFEQMQELGFLMDAESGCMYPYENFSSSSKGRPKGHKVAAYFFKGGQLPKYDPHKFGWPVIAQVSHLCHNKDCVNPNHLIYEPQWKNLKRNFCGDSGKCDCGVKPSCLAPYSSNSSSSNVAAAAVRTKNKTTWLTYDTPDFKNRIHQHLSGLRYSILPKKHFDSVDKKRQQRLERIHGKRDNNKNAKRMKMSVEKKL